ncbi:MAG: hypothetical protein ABIE94_04920 [archaeon]
MQTLTQIIITVILIFVILVAFVEPIRAGLFKDLPGLLGLEDKECSQGSFYLCRNKDKGEEIGRLSICEMRNKEYPIGFCLTINSDTDKCDLSCFNAEGEESLESQMAACEEIQDRHFFKWWFEAKHCYEKGYCFVHKGPGPDECLHCKFEDNTGGAHCIDLQATQHQKFDENEYLITKAQCEVCNDEFREMDKPTCYFDNETGECLEND